MDLFNQQNSEPLPPLAERIRPKNLDGFVGQEHLVGIDSVLRQQLKSGTLGSMIFWGPPGCGKTTLARILAYESQADFCQISAVSAGVKDVKTIIDQASYNLTAHSRKTILFIDEIHRFNKAQQDVLLKSVEEGTLILIGATTENPSFEVISPLLSRCRIYKLNPLSPDKLALLARRALEEDKTIQSLHPIVDEETLESLIDLAGGDARIVLNGLEAALVLVKPSEQDNNRHLTISEIEKVLQRKSLLYDKKGEYHYDIISAFIKSMRGSDPDAAAYWLMRMLDSGEDPLFVARRMVILASEDIGNADPFALPLATAAYQATHAVGMPEAEIILMHCALYLASAEKSNAVVQTIANVRQTLKENPDASVPLHLRNAPTKYMASEGYGKGYKYPHLFEGNFMYQEYLPKEMCNKIFYNPTTNGRERLFKERLEKLWKKRGKKE